jgi:carbon starvation protein CstA
MRIVGYGAMLTESFVGVMALIAAVTLAPGIYLAMNHPPLPGAPKIGAPSAVYAKQITDKVSGYGDIFKVTPDEMNQASKDVQEASLYNRTGGGPSLAVGMARIFSKTLGGAMLPFWYHFAIMFEAVFILTVLDSGTRVIRFVIHELLHDFAAMRTPNVPDKEIHHIKIPIWVTSLLAVLGWGLILSWGIIDAQGGTRALIKMFGTANQLLAVIALSLATVLMIKKHRKYAWVTGLPMLVVATITLTAATQTIFSSDPRVGTVGAIAAAQKVLGDATLKQHAATFDDHAVAVIQTASANLHNAWITAFITGMLLVFVVTVLLTSLKEAVRLLRTPPVSNQPAQEGA